MIRIQRDRLDDAGLPIRPGAAWFERARDATSRACLEEAAHEAERDVYAHPEVRAALEKLFSGKCAYCESRITATFDWEVEHFRPKARVAERPDHPGYYWLAYEWSNLYPTCTLCNQRRYDRPFWGEAGQLGIGGKGDQFPLADESTRAMSPADELARERPLLLDPCGDDPEAFLSFTLTGEAVSLENNPRGLATIEVFRLNRRRLLDLRRGVIEAILQLLALLNTRREEISEAARADFAALLHRWTTDDSREYAAVARAVLRDPEAFGIRGR